MGRPRNSVSRMLNTDVEKTPGCWNWIGQIGENGYGKTAILKESLVAHRVFYEHFHGPIPADKVVIQTCRNRRCVNPAHLRAVSHLDKILLGDSPSSINAKKHACIRGHRLAGGNLYVTPDGRRQCRACMAIREHRRQKQAQQSGQVAHG